MMIKKAIILTIILLFLMGTVSAGNNTTNDVPTPINHKYSDKIIESQENGHLNTSFSDNFNGYCLEYGEKEAEIGDKFYVVDTSYAINNKNKQSISDYLKIFFIEHYDFVQKMPPVYTQHIIWHFSDDFYHPVSIGQNMKIIDSILNSTHKYPDSGSKIFNKTHKMYFIFNVFLPFYTHHQNYFAYKIWFEEIKENVTILQNNSIKYQNNVSQKQNNSIIEKKTRKSVDISTYQRQNSQKMRETGFGIVGLFCSIITICVLIFTEKKT